MQWNYLENVWFGHDADYKEGSINLKSNFSLNSIAPKITEILDKILPYEARVEFCQIHISFWGGNGVSRKNAFEIH